MTINTFFLKLLSNQVLIGGIAGWFAAQFCKTLLYAIINHKLDITRFWGDGGMPSAHSATVSCMAVTAGIVYGVDSFPFAVCVIVALITMRDAMGVRLETGKQAKLLNMIMEQDIFKLNMEQFQEKLKEFVGHTPLQVFAGAILGVILALLVNLMY